MKYRLRMTSQFKKDIKLMKKRGREIWKLENILNRLADGETLPPDYQDHALSGRYAGFRECHIQSDWLLVYYLDNDLLVLVCSRTGSHSDFF